MLHISPSIAINRPPHEIYEGWRDLDNLPRVVPELESVALQGRRALTLGDDRRGVDLPFSMRSSNGRM